MKYQLQFPSFCLEDLSILPSIYLGISGYDIPALVSMTLFPTYLISYLYLSILLSIYLCISGYNIPVLVSMTLFPIYPIILATYIYLSYFLSI